MSVRDEFKTWRNRMVLEVLNGHEPSLESAYRAGALAMRERAARLIEQNVVDLNKPALIPVTHDYPDQVRHTYSSAIRALDVEAP